MDFTTEEQEYLEQCLYDVIEDDVTGEEIAVVGNGYCVITIVKNGNDDFTYFHDLLLNDDLDKANSNYTVNGLTWEELCYELGLFPWLMIDED